MAVSRTHALGTGRDHRAASKDLGSLRGLLPYFRPYRLAIAGAALALIFTSSAVLGMGGALRFLVDEAVGKGDPDLLDTSFFILLGVVVLLAFASYSRFFLVSYIGEHMVADLRRDLYRHILGMDAPFFETTRIGEVLSRITTDTTLLQTVVGSSVSVALRNTLLILGGTVLLLVTSAQLTGYVLLVIPLVVIPIILLGRRVRLLSRDTQDRVADLSAMAEETLSGIRTIQAFTLEEKRTDIFHDGVQEARRTAMRRVRMRALLTAIVIMLIFGAIAGVLWLGGRYVMDGTITPGELSAFIFYAVVVAGAVGAISEVIGDLQRAAGAAERILDLMQQRPTVADPEEPRQLPASVSGRLALEHVNFAYPARPQVPALEDVSLTIEPGQKLAIVGPSGAGKTTVFQLLQRFYDPQGGRLCLDGVDIRDYRLHDLRSQIAVVPQEAVIFSANAWENIRIGRQNATDEEVLAAAEAAAARGFLEALPEGLDSFLGEKGVRLSGGQRQRIAIARAVLKQAPVLLLDEATSALDSENETLVQQALDHAMRDRTTLVIAHRLSTVLKADRIVVMEQGRIEAMGRHEELLDSSPLYRRLAELQFGATGLAA